LKCSLFVLTKLHCRIFTTKDLAVSNSILFTANLGLGFYMYYRRHLHRLKKWDRIVLICLAILCLNLQAVYRLIVTGRCSCDVQPGEPPPPESPKLRRSPAFPSGSLARSEPIPGSTIVLVSKSHGGKSSSDPQGLRLPVVHSREPWLNQHISEKW
uniref:Very-long-chain 3-oxoacyl-CoA synthase n=1 Tax=Angiostrongylus cantonensis TaxID=6313 RepID=A0A0K0CVH3_ANGCA